MGSSSLYDVLRGVAGIPVYPAAVAAANGVSIAEVLRYTQDLAIEIAANFYEKERWYGKKEGNDETNAIANTLTPFRVTSGVGTYGTAVCVIGTDDVAMPGKTVFDLHRILCSNFQKAELGKIRVAWGSSSAADAVAAGDYSTYMTNPQNTTKEAIDDVKVPPIENSLKVWVYFWSTTNSQWVDLFIGTHGI
jgi:hypothetical protein